MNKYATMTAQQEEHENTAKTTSGSLKMTENTLKNSLLGMQYSNPLDSKHSKNNNYFPNLGRLRD